MARKRTVTEQMELLSDKEILIAFCSGLTDGKSRKAYLLLKQEFDVDRSKGVWLNGYGHMADCGLVRMTSKQYHRLLAECSEYKIKWMVGRLHEYLDYIQEQAKNGCAKSKRQFKLYRDSSCYPKLTGNGWVHQEYLKYGSPPPDEPKGIDFFSISNEKMAMEYIESLPLQMGMDSPELEFLASRYSSVREYLIKRGT